MNCKTCGKPLTKVSRAYSVCLDCDGRLVPNEPKPRGVMSKWELPRADRVRGYEGAKRVRRMCWTIAGREGVYVRGSIADGNTIAAIDTHTNMRIGLVLAKGVSTSKCNSSETKS